MKFTPGSLSELGTVVKVPEGYFCKGATFVLPNDFEHISHDFGDPLIGPNSQLTNLASCLSVCLFKTKRERERDENVKLGRSRNGGGSGRSRRRGINMI